MALHRHDIHQTGQVTVVNIRTIETDHVPELRKDRTAHSLNAQHNKHLHNVVADGSRGVNVVHTEDRHEIRTICFEYPLVTNAKSLLVVPYGLFGSSTDKDLLHVVDTTQLQAA